MTWRASSTRWPWLWGVIGLVTLTSPVLILLFYPLLRSSGDESDGGGGKVGRCRLTVTKPVLKAPMVSALETIIS